MSGMPSDVSVIDLMIGVPHADRSTWHEDFRGLIRDEGSREELRHGAGYMYKELPDFPVDGAFPDFLVANMDRHGVERALIPVTPREPIGRAALRDHPTRFLG